MIVTMDADQAALAGLAEDVGRALIRYATRLRSSGAADPLVRQEGGPVADVPSPAGTVATTISAGADPALGPTAPLQVDVKTAGLGVSQKKVLEAVHASGPGGATASQVAAATGLKSTNTPRMLKTLAERGLVSSEGSNPIIWYVPAS